MKVRATSTAQVQKIFEQKLRYVLFTKDSINHRPERLKELIKAYPNNEIPKSWIKKGQTIFEQMFNLQKSEQ